MNLQHDSIIEYLHGKLDYLVLNYRPKKQLLLSLKNF